MTRHVREGIRMAGLRASDVTVENGGKHLKLFVAGKLATVTPYSPKRPDWCAKLIAKDLRTA